MRIWPAVLTVTRRQRIGPAGAQSPPPGLVILNMARLPAGSRPGVTRPTPLKPRVEVKTGLVTAAPVAAATSAVATAALAEPPPAGRPWIAAGQSATPSSSRSATGSTQPTVHDAPSPSTKLTAVLRRTASARARLSPSWIASAASRIRALRIQWEKPGRAGSQQYRHDGDPDDQFDQCQAASGLGRP